MNRRRAAVATTDLAHDDPTELPEISFSHVTKHYGAVTALDHVSADVTPGRINACLGANGSGS